METEPRRLLSAVDSARLRAVAWAARDEHLELVWRRAGRGREAGPPVTVRLTGVRAVAVGYDPAELDCPPSRFRAPRRLGADELTCWPFALQEAELVVDSPSAIEEGLAACEVDWLLGDERALRAARQVVCVVLDPFREAPDAPPARVHLLLACAEMALDGAHEPEPEPEAQPGPAGPRRSGQPLLRPGDAPAELVQPLRDLFEGAHAGDWGRVARAFPGDAPHSQRAAELARSCDLGRWGCAREVEQWWIEGGRACVALRGVDPSGAASSRCDDEARWTFDLRRRDGGWVIRAWTLAWPG